MSLLETMVPLRNTHPQREWIRKHGHSCRTLRKVYGLLRPCDNHPVLSPWPADLILAEFWLRSKRYRQLPVTVLTGCHKFSERQGSTSTSSHWVCLAGDALWSVGTRETFQLFDSTQEQAICTRELERDLRSYPGEET
ncbi:hypothetical protein TNIN_231181 [Trichonephila inaurata madagascariensis]|uniref:Uncharacterized protein n=1 Tax=Trichonephila inaurata madagascariensis TaxID=2747483 RepID=A0A8X7C934_9ARAC|nr:hypothetical protein TNIN_231181 [Trichonephila inaurata madagascariensis]